MAWFRKFDEPIPPPNGRELLTLSEAADFIIGLPPEIIALPDWQIAMAALGQVSETEACPHRIPESARWPAARTDRPLN